MRWFHETCENGAERFYIDSVVPSRFTQIYEIEIAKQRISYKYCPKKGDMKAFLSTHITIYVSPGYFHLLAEMVKQIESLDDDEIMFLDPVRTAPTVPESRRRIKCMSNDKNAQMDFLNAVSDYVCAFPEVKSAIFKVLELNPAPTPEPEMIYESPRASQTQRFRSVSGSLLQNSSFNMYPSTKKSSCDAPRPTDGYQTSSSVCK
jgi:hypothetical protein